MGIFKTLSELSELQTKQDYFLHVKNELKAITKKLKESGYTITRSYKITAPKTIIYECSDDVFYFKRLRFIYNGLKYDKWPDDSEHSLFFTGLRGFVESQYNELP